MRSMAVSEIPASQSGETSKIYQSKLKVRTTLTPYTLNCVVRNMVPFPGISHYATTNIMTANDLVIHGAKASGAIVLVLAWGPSQYKDIVLPV